MTAHNAALASELLGLAAGGLRVDVGPGTCEFDRYLRTVRAWSGRCPSITLGVTSTSSIGWSRAGRAGAA